MPATNQREAIRARWAKPHNVQQRLDTLGEHIRRVVDSLPPLTDEQREQLAAILAPAVETVAARRQPRKSSRRKAGESK